MRKEELRQPEGTMLRAYYDTREEKAGWGPGPWQAEPDKVSWTDGVTKLPCLIVRNRLGALCGYVGVGSDHPLFGMHYGHTAVEEIDVHGGLTFSSNCNSDAPEEDGICHIPEPGAEDHVWWFGFDNAHSQDFVPGMEATMRRIKTMPDLPEDSIWRSVYRDINYVAAEVHSLARQLDAMKNMPRQHHELNAENFDMAGWMKDKGLPGPWDQ